MIPLHLTLQGVYSYKKKQTVDFTSLTKAGIFGVFGATGSGKSAIIEAISFALYGETERLNKLDSRGYNMMNLQSNELYIDFECSSEITNLRYKFTVSAHRNKKQFDKVSTTERMAYKFVNNEWIPQDLSVVEQEVTGLSYQNFKRTVIIPQGHFMEFLHLAPTDRTKMLKDIFGLQEYELWDKTRLLENEEKERFARLDERIQQLGEVSIDEYNSKNEQIILLDSKLQETDALYKAKQKQAELLNQIAKDFADFEAENIKFKSLESQNERFELLNSKIQNIQYCITHFDELTQSILHKDNNLHALETNLLSKKNIEQTLHIELKDSEALYKTKTELFNQLPAFTEVSKDLAKILEIKKCSEEIENLRSSTLKGKQFILDVQKELVETQNKKEELIQIVKEKKKNSTNIQQLSELKHTVIQYNKIIAEIETVRKQRVSFDLEIKEIHQKITAQLELVKLKPTTNTAEYKDQLSKAIDTNKNEIQQVHSRIQAFQLQQEIAVLHTHLQDGTPCPVCGSQEHPNAGKPLPKFDDNDLLLSKKQLEQFQNTLLEASSSLALFSQQITHLKEQDSIASKKMHELTIERNLTEPDSKLTLAEIEKEIAAYTLLQEFITTSEKQIENFGLIEKEKTQILEKAKLKIDTIEVEITKASASKETLINQCNKNTFDEFKEYSLESIVDIIEKRTLEHQQIESEYQKSKAQFELLNQKHTELKSSIQTIDNQAKQIREDLIELNKNLTIAITNSSFNSIEDVKTVLLEKERLLEYSKQYQEYHEAYKTSQNRLLELKEKTANNSYNKENHQNVIIELTTLENQLLQIRKEHNEQVLLLKQYKEKLDNHKDILAKLNNSSNRLENFATLQKLFKGSGFVNYMSTRYLQNLCTIANTRFSIFTKHSLQLEIDDSNSFKVRDYMNNGQLRHIKTLSGGQAFQAALSLALALSETIHVQSPLASNFFFIDEGFGSQDKNSLQIVFETLRSLQSEGKIVGVISHVEELQEHIPCNLFVKQTEEGSCVFQ